MSPNGDINFNSIPSQKNKQGRIMTILELQYDADPKKAVPETY